MPHRVLLPLFTFLSLTFSLFLGGCDEEVTYTYRELCDPMVTSLTPASGSADGGYEASLGGTHLVRDGEDTWDLTIRVGGVAASLTAVSREGCGPCDACREDDTCDACVEECDGREGYGDEEASACVETVTFLLPPGAPGVAEVVVATPRGTVTGPSFEFRAPCEDGVDNDGDGRWDGDDPGCMAGETETGPCENGLDDDQDGWQDVTDPGCGSSEAGTSEGGFSGDACNNGLDDDGDGAVDGEDPGCDSGHDDEEGGGSGSCFDGLDNDEDGWGDEADPDCASPDGEEQGLSLSACNNGVDDDGDGFTDADDIECTDGFDPEE